MIIDMLVIKRKILDFKRLFVMVNFQDITNYVINNVQYKRESNFLYLFLNSLLIVMYLYFHLTNSS